MTLGGISVLCCHDPCRDSQPSYQDIERVLAAWPKSQTTKGWLDRLKDEWAWNQDSLKGPQ